MLFTEILADNKHDNKKSKLCKRCVNMSLKRDTTGGRGAGGVGGGGGVVISNNNNNTEVKDNLNSIISIAVYNTTIFYMEFTVID